MVYPPGFSQPVPLVPLTEANEEAMDNKQFKKLLRKLGLRAPANEQVCYGGVFCVISQLSQSLHLILVIILLLFFCFIIKQFENHGYS